MERNNQTKIHTSTKIQDSYYKLVSKTERKMSCSIAVSNNVCHSTFSTSNSNTWVNVDSSSNNFSDQHPLNNLMVKFEQQVDTMISTTNHRHIPLMKRRRPSKISIPVSNLSHLVDNIGAKSSSDNDELLEIEVEGDGYGVFCKKGKSRTHLEDRYSAILNTIPGHTTKQAFFGIFDGHGGARAAEFTAKRLGRKILENVGSRKNAKNEEGKCKKATIEDDIRGCFLEVDKEFISSSSSSSDNATDHSSGGTCCITAFIEGGTLMVSNLGDCRAVISRGGVAEPLSVDHTPARHDEKLRIQSKGGYVDECSGVWRVQGTLGVSRAIGDGGLKQWVIAEPETKTMSIQPDCDFLILASDGLWDKVTNQEAVDVVVPLCTATANAAGACRKLVELSMSRGSNDDTSVLIIHLAPFLS